jgi:hypothetical protein
VSEVVTEIVLLDVAYARVSDRAIRLPGAEFTPAQVRRLWVETRHPGQAFGAGLIVVGACLVLKGGGLLKLVGAALVAAGVIRARAEVHTLMVQLHGEESARPALRTAHADRARQVLAAVEQARRAAAG